jgi:hypothetical protein
MLNFLWKNVSNVLMQLDKLILKYDIQTNEMEQGVQNNGNS